MAKISILIMLLPHLLCTMVQGQNDERNWGPMTSIFWSTAYGPNRTDSPCWEYYALQNSAGIMRASIRTPFLPANDKLYHLRVAINTHLDPNTPVIRLRDRSIRLEWETPFKKDTRGRPLLYSIYSPGLVIVTGIWLNNLQYCPGPEERIANTTILMGHILYPQEPLSLNSSSNESPHREVTYDIIYPSNEYLNYLTSSISVNRPNTIAKCGITNYYTDDTNRLLADGEQLLPGQWPWLVAIFIVTPNKLDYRFQCSGSLLTTSHVITAASCLGTISSDPINPDFLFVVFGPSNSLSEAGTTNRSIASYKIYPDESVDSSDFNVAILLLKTPVEYNAFISPVCLWSNWSNFSSVNETGYVVRWDDNALVNFKHRAFTNSEGTDDESGRLSQKQPDFHPYQLGPDILRPRLRNESACYSNRGNGLIYFDSTTGRYQLRGIVADFGPNPCLYLSNHIVYIFIDIAKVTYWIQHNIA